MTAQTFSRVPRRPHSRAIALMELQFLLYLAQILHGIRPRLHRSNSSHNGWALFGGEKMKQLDIAELERAAR